MKHSTHFTMTSNDFFALKEYEGQRLSSGDKIVYQVLCSHLYGKRYCYPSIKTIANESALAARSVPRSLVRLQAAGLITIMPRKTRELIIALPECFAALEPKALLQQFTDYFKNTYDVECISALHHNKSKTNYHIHLIFSERKLLSSLVIKLGKNNPLSANIKRNNHSFTQVTFFHFVADKLKNIFVHNKSSI